MLKVPETSQVVELEEIGREQGGDEGNLDARPSEPEASSGNQEAEVAEGNHEAGVDQSMEVAEGKLSGKSVRFAPDLST